MTDLVERVARALHECFLRDWDGAEQTTWDELAPQSKEFGLNQARAAITVIAKMQREEALKRMEMSLNFPVSIVPKYEGSPVNLVIVEWETEK